MARARWLERQEREKRERTAAVWANFAVNVHLDTQVHDVLSHPSPELAAVIRANEQLVLNAIDGGWRERFVKWYRDLEFDASGGDDLAGEIERRIRQADLVMQAPAKS